MLLMAVAMALVLGGGYALYVLEMPVEEYPTYAAAVADGAIARGWLPSWFPAGGTDIREVHDLDTNERWVSFTLPSAEARRMVAPFRRISWQEARRTARARPGRAGSDWPEQLGPIAPMKPVPSDDIGFYRSDLDAYCLAVEWRTNRVWGWSCEAAG